MSNGTAIPGWYIEFQANVLRQLPRPDDLDQVTAEGWSANQKALKNVLTGVLLLPSQDKSIITAPCFPLLTTFQFTVSDGYNHSTQLASFAKENREKFYFYNDNLTDKNFSRVTKKLIPGKTYEAKIFGITKKESSQNCLDFLKSQKAILVGTQGISVVWQEAKDQFLKGKWTISFDEKEALCRGGGDGHGVPSMKRGSDDGWRFSLGYFEGVWFDDTCLLCVRDLSA